MDQRILVVDSDAKMRTNLLYGLLQEGYSVVICTDCESALMMLESAKANESYTDAVVLGASLADLDTMRLASEIRNKFPYTSILCVSRVGNDDSGLKLIEGPNTAYISQPFETRELMAALDQLTRGKACLSGEK